MLPFTGAPFAYVRTPLLPYETAWRFFGSDWQRQLEAFLRGNQTLCLAIHIASPSLSRELSAWLESGQISERAARRILAYVLRASTRTTPFGMFAAVSRVEAGSVNTLRIRSEIGTRTRPDMAWLRALADGWKRDPHIRRMLKVCINDALLLRGQRYTAYHPSLVHRTRGSESPLTYTSVSFKETQPVAFLKETLTSPERLTDIAARLEQRFGATREECLQLLDQLWECGFFVDELELDPSGEPVQATLDALTRIDEERAGEMRRFLAALDAFDRTPVSAKSVAEYCILEERQRAVDPGREPRLQTDSVRETAGTLSQRVLDDAALLADVMLHWHPFEMKQYRQRFIERYEGSTREVPLLELIHPSLGLGVPDDLDVAYALPAELVEKRVAIASQALLDGATEVALSETELKALLPPREDHRIAGSFDIGFEVLARSASEIERGNYHILTSPLVYAPAAGGSIGRFADALGASAQSDLRTLRSRIENVFEDAAVAELVLASNYARGLNVSLRPVHLAYQVRVGLMSAPDATSHITPADLIVGLDGAGFYVRSLSLNKRVEIVQTHVYNTADLAPSLGRFLSLLSFEGVIFPHLFDWGVAEKLSFLPRLRCGRVIVAKARWHLQKDEVVRACAGDRTGFLRRWRLPRYVQLVEQDAVMPLDLSSEAGWQLLRDHAASGPKNIVRFEELLPGEGDVWLQDEHGGRYRAEFVASFVRTRAVSRAVPTGAAISRSERVQPPGSEWTYAKLYTDADDMDRFLAREVAPLVASLSANAAAANWFFVRYADSSDHVRLRIKHAAHEHGEVARIFGERFDEWVKSGVLTKVEVATYEREIERYGGIEAMEICERWFGADSTYVLQEFLAERALQDEERVAFACETLAHIASVCGRLHGSDPAGFVRFTRKTTLTEADRAILRALRTKLANGTTVRFPEASEYIEALFHVHQAGRLRSPFAEVVDSLMHMHCNRCGLSPALEQRARAIARQALHGAARMHTTV